MIPRPCQPAHRYDSTGHEEPCLGLYKQGSTAHFTLKQYKHILNGHLKDQQRKHFSLNVSDSSES